MSEPTVWLCFTTRDYDGQEMVVGAYASRDAALADLGQRLLDAEPGLAEGKPRLQECALIGAAPVAPTPVTDLIRVWRGMTTTNRTRVADRHCDLADALDALCFPLMVAEPIDEGPF